MRRHWSVAALMSLVVTANAQAGSLLDARITASNLAYQVVDLTPDDGVDATLQWGSPYFPSSSNTGMSVYAGHAGSDPEYGSLTNWGLPFDDTSDSLAISGVQVSKAGTSMTAAVQINSETVEQDLAATPVGDTFGSMVTSHAGLVQLGWDLGSHDFVLAPHTQVTFTGQLSASLVANLGELSASAAFQNFLPSGQSLSFRSNALLSISILEPGTFNGFGQTHGQILNLHTDETGAWVTEDLVNEVSPGFSLTLVNDTDDIMHKQIDLSVRAEGSLYVMGVPEPSTTLLMGLGLFALIAISRRQGAARQ